MTRSSHLASSGHRPADHHHQLSFWASAQHQAHEGFHAHRTRLGHDRRETMEPIPPLLRPVDMDLATNDTVDGLRPAMFEAFYRLVWPDVHRPLAATIGDADLAAEAVDEAMVRAYARWGTVRGCR